MHDVATPYLGINIRSCDHRALNGEQWDGSKTPESRESLACACVYIPATVYALINKLKFNMHEIAEYPQERKSENMLHTFLSLPVGEL